MLCLLQCKAAGGEVPGHLCGGLVVCDGSGVHGRHGAPVCGAERLGGAAAAVGASGVLDLHLLGCGLLCGDMGHPIPACFTGGASILCACTREHSYCTPPTIASNMLGQCMSI